MTVILVIQTNDDNIEQAMQYAASSKNGRLYTAEKKEGEKKKKRNKNERCEERERERTIEKENETIATHLQNINIKYNQIYQ